MFVLLQLSFSFTKLHPHSVPFGNVMLGVMENGEEKTCVRLKPSLPWEYHSTSHQN